MRRAGRGSATGRGPVSESALAGSSDVPELEQLREVLGAALRGQRPDVLER